VRTPHTPVLDIYVGGDRPAVSVGEGGGGAGPYPELKVWGENTFLGGKIIVFVKCFNKNISGH